MRRRAIWVVVGTLALSGSLRERMTAGQDGRGPIVNSEFLYEQAPFRSCHASTVAESTEGLVAAWFGGTAEGRPDVGIWVARKRPEGWTAPVEVANGVQPDGGRFPCWNPVLFQVEGGRLLLFYKVGPSPRAWWGMMIASNDAGASWSKPTRLPDGILGPIKNKPERLTDGTLLSPSSTEDQGWRVHMERSSDLGKTWTRTRPLNEAPAFGLIQPSILRHSDQTLQIVCRSRQGRVVSLWSRDGGTTWGDPELTELPNPNSGIDAVTLRDGRHLIVYNHTPKGRSPLNVALSDDGKSWTKVLDLETEPGEYSYPAVIQTSDGLIHVTYTWKRQRVKHVTLDPQKLGTKSAAQPAGLSQTDVFLAGSEGYHTFRIPSLLVAPGGDLLAFCEGRKAGRGDSGDIDLVFKRSRDGGATWGAIQVLADFNEDTIGNPCPVVDRSTGRIWLLLTRNRGSDVERAILDGESQGTRTVWVAHSDDDGATWSEPREITPQVKPKDWTWYATGPGVGIQLKSGRLLIPCDHFLAGSKEARSHVIYSDDHGATWKLGGSIGGGLNECQAAELSDGSVVLNMRNHPPRPGAGRAVSTSADGGMTWTEPVRDPSLPEPGCQASLIRLAGTERDGLLFSNPAGAKREAMTVRRSLDGGRSWPDSWLIHEGPSAYSCLANLPEGMVGCLYERGERSPYERITFARFTVGPLKTSREDPGSVRVAGIVLKWVRGDKEANFQRAEPLIREAAA
ncbi:MAG: exo-alpha-sialidase, partial [Isosphaeraceae bacterium]